MLGPRLVMRMTGEPQALVEVMGYSVIMEGIKILACCALQGVQELGL